MTPINSIIIDFHQVDDSFCEEPDVPKRSVDSSDYQMNESGDSGVIDEEASEMKLFGRFDTMTLKQHVGKKIMELEDEKQVVQKERDRLQAEIQNLSATSDGQTQKLQDLHSHKNLIYQMRLKLDLSLMEHYERHCPLPESRFNSFIPPPTGYKFSYMFWVQGYKLNNAVTLLQIGRASDGEGPAWAPFFNNYMLTTSKLQDWDNPAIRIFLTSMAQNYLTGPLLPSVGNLTQMQWIINALSGEIPSQLGRLTDL
ncbi:kinesin-like protein KIN-4A [Tanacetum coccineum]